jgi:hypothetical protein
MRKAKITIAIASMALCLAFDASGQSNGQASTQWSPEARQQAVWNTEQQNDKAWQDSVDNNSRRQIKNLPKIREHLAQTWQQFGLKPDAAKAIASTYVITGPEGTPTTIKGKTDAEVASMMQQALSNKKFLLANQLLIQYERRRLHLPETRR